MSDPYPDPTQTGAPANASDVDLAGPLFRRVWLAVMAATLAVVAVVIAFQSLG
jgi:hypothetical protein